MSSTILYFDSLLEILKLTHKEPSQVESQVYLILYFRGLECIWFDLQCLWQASHLHTSRHKIFIVCIRNSCARQKRPRSTWNGFSLQLAYTIRASILACEFALLYTATQVCTQMRFASTLRLLRPCWVCISLFLVLVLYLSLSGLTLQRLQL